MGLQAVQKRGPRATLAFLYQRLAAAGDFPPEALKRLAETPEATAAALFLNNPD